MSTLVVSNLSDGSNSTSSTNAIRGSAKAWVNFDGSAATPTIRQSHNTSSLVDNGVGLYSINMTTAMTDTSYIITANAKRSDPTSLRCTVAEDFTTARTTSQFTVMVTAGNNGTSVVDSTIVMLGVIR